MPSTAIDFKGFDKGLTIYEGTLHPNQSTRCMLNN